MGKKNYKNIHEWLQTNVEFSTLWLFDFMTGFYFPLAAWWFIFGTETLNEINLCFQTQRSALEIIRAFPRVPKQHWVPYSLLPFRWPHLMNYLGQNEFALSSSEIRTPSGFHSMNLPTTPAKSLLLGVGNPNNSEQSDVDNLVTSDKSLGKPWN